MKMCDLVGGHAIVTRPRGDGPAAAAAARALNSVAERYQGQVVGNLDSLLSLPLPSAWDGETSFDKSDRPPLPTSTPFQLELFSIQKGAEFSFAEELRGEYLEIALRDTRGLRARDI